MTRISSSMISDAGRADIMRAQRELLEAQRQLASQRKADDLKGYGGQSQSIISSKRLVSQAESYASVAKEAQTRLTIQDASLGRASDALSDLKQKIIEGMALGEVGQLMERVGETFDTVKQSLNMALGGRFLFAGAVDDRPPVTADSPDALIGQPLGSAFEPDLRQGFVQIDETRVIATGPLASDLADQAMQAFQALAEANAGPDGPFNGRPTQAQTDALQAVLQQLDGAFESVLQAQGQNGSALAAAELAVTQQSARADTLSGIISEKTDVDLSEAAVKITQAQLQFQASAQAFNTVRGMSLLDFLR